MFVSTVVPSTMLDVTANLNQSPYNFSLPYNFVRGRSIIVSIQPHAMSAAANWSVNALNEGCYPLKETEPGRNRVHVTIPTDVTEYETTMEIYHTAAQTAWSVVAYTVTVKFDVAKQIITFTPISKRAVTGTLPVSYNTVLTAPVLVTVSTIL